jgi:hypothetical protein
VEIVNAADVLKVQFVVQQRSEVLEAECADDAGDDAHACEEIDEEVEARMRAKTEEDSAETPRRAGQGNSDTREMNSLLSASLSLSLSLPRAVAM